MAGVGEVMRSVQETQQGAREALESLSSGAAQSGKSVSGLAEFFQKPDNLLALAVCLMAVVGIYHLLRAENIIPATNRQGGSLFASFLARRLALRIILFVVVAAIGLALAMGRLTGLLETFKHFF